jgi:hypothetical protein
VTSSPASDSKVKSGAGSPSASTAASVHRAVGIVRQSRQSGDDPVFPVEQRQRIEATCDREGFELLQVLPEKDVSGGAPLKKAPAFLTPLQWSRRSRRK